MQPGSMDATNVQGRSLTSVKTASAQVSAHRPQNVHSPCLKSTTGVRPGPGTKIASGQAATQSPQLVHFSMTEASVLQGGRMTTPRPVRTERRLDVAKRAADMGSARRRSVDQLRHPDDEAQSSDNGNRKGGRQKDREGNEGATLVAFRRRMRCGWAGFWPHLFGPFWRSNRFSHVNVKTLNRDGLKQCI